MHGCKNWDAFSIKHQAAWHQLNQQFTFYWWMMAFQDSADSAVDFLAKFVEQWHIWIWLLLRGQQLKIHCCYYLLWWCNSAFGENFLSGWTNSSCLPEAWISLWRFLYFWCWIIALTRNKIILFSIFFFSPSWWTIVCWYFFVWGERGGQPPSFRASCFATQDDCFDLFIVFISRVNFFVFHAIRAPELCYSCSTISRFHCKMNILEIYFKHSCSIKWRVINIRIKKYLHIPLNLRGFTCTGEVKNWCPGVAVRYRYCDRTTGS